MIICASRRTDIPAFHSEWFMDRLRSGHVLVRNPVRRDVIYDISLKRQDVDCLFLISKDPRPLEQYMEEILSEGHQLLFHVTVNPYGRDLEPHVPDVSDVTGSFRRISSEIGNKRMIWRYDPVIFNERYDLQFHEDSFERICSELEGYTNRCVFSFLSKYEKLAQYYDSGILRDVTVEEKRSFCSSASKIAKYHGIELTSCCVNDDLLSYGVRRRACLDADDLRALDIPFEPRPVPTREGCLCIQSIDIGMYDTCLHDCTYCYANSADGRRRMNMSFDPGNEMLCGKVGENDRIIRIGRRANRRISDY